MDAVIKEQIAFFSQMAQPFNWKIFEHNNADFLEKRLKAHGFERVADDYDVIMVLDLEDLAERFLVSDNKDVRQLLQAEQIWDVVNVLDEAYGGDYSWLHQRMGPIIELPGYLNLFAGYEEGKPVACGWAYCYPGIEFAALFGGTTIKDHRGDGWFTSILAYRVQCAKALGRRYVTMGVEPECQRMLENFGFNRISSAYYLYWKGVTSGPP
jgi:hypothetical protein